MRLLTFTSLYPNAAQPGHGPFVEVRLRKLMESGEVDSRVVAPVPWFPSVHTRFGRYGEFAQVPRSEQRYGIKVLHPRYLTLPGLGVHIAPWSMAMAGRAALLRTQKSGYDFEAIDAHYFYPDGVAAAMLGRWFQRPVVITARGTDINLLPQYTGPRRMILEAARKVAAIITVSQALKDELVRLGVASEKVEVLRNGVDSHLFRPVPQDDARSILGLATGENAGPILASVGSLVTLKGHHLVIEALAALPGVRLVIAGRGPEQGRLEALALKVGVADRVTFLGQIAQVDLPVVYSAANLLILASCREGWPNVLLESMACGTPAIATQVGGSAEVITAPEAGRLLERQDSRAIVDAVKVMLSDPPLREATRRYAEAFGWDSTTAGQRRVFAAAIAGAANSRCG